MMVATSELTAKFDKIELDIEAESKEIESCQNELHIDWKFGLSRYGKIANTT